MLKTGLHYRVILNLKFDVAKDKNYKFCYSLGLPQGNFFYR